MRKPCIKCLIQEWGDESLVQSVQAYQSSIAEEERAEDAIYQKRLLLCRECEWLRQGICGKCGCFVEARAYRAKAACPHEHSRW